MRGLRYSPTNDRLKIARETIGILKSEQLSNDLDRALRGMQDHQLTDIVLDNGKSLSLRLVVKREISRRHLSRAASK